MSATYPSYIRILCVEVVRNQYELYSSVAYISVAAEGQKGIQLPCQRIQVGGATGTPYRFSTFLNGQRFNHSFTLHYSQGSLDSHKRQGLDTSRQIFKGRCNEDSHHKGFWISLCTTQVSRIPVHGSLRSCYKIIKVGYWLQEAGSRSETSVRTQQHVLCISRCSEHSVCQLDFHLTLCSPQ
jgi:hypothetical protein